jgi:hypothetical protein
VTTPDSGIHTKSSHPGDPGQFLNQKSSAGYDPESDHLDHLDDTLCDLAAFLVLRDARHPARTSVLSDRSKRISDLSGGPA